MLDFAAVFLASPIERIEWLKHGVRAGLVGEMAARMNTSDEQLMKRLGFPRATVARKAKADQNLSTAQGERLVGMSKLIGQVQILVDQSGNSEGFNAASWVGKWLERPTERSGGEGRPN
ncbi:antitoxin Xre-like helix-turn-helix domain-containing protein [Trinickia fusca]|uniref:antitoxin Xre-like helix-turn-helix domain-containing protein n=1 Tax=Trinickia fusca TaxID=2419777 RepID=UPI001FE2ABD5|nr:antitoxin Xre-like helix-turn-helix domain-containing protein [Trinickia fusca]